MAQRCSSQLHPLPFLKMAMRDSLVFLVFVTVLLAVGHSGTEGDSAEKGGPSHRESMQFCLPISISTELGVVFPNRDDHLRLLLAKGPCLRDFQKRFTHPFVINLPDSEPEPSLKPDQNSPTLVPKSPDQATSKSEKSKIMVLHHSAVLLRRQE
jgi:hypothetical protein